MTEKGKKAMISPPHIAKNTFYAEISGDKRGMNIIFSAVNSVREFSDNRLVLRFKGFCLGISGEGLIIRTFEDGALSVYGKISGWEMIYDRTF